MIKYILKKKGLTFVCVGAITGYYIYKRKFLIPTLTKEQKTHEYEKMKISNLPKRNELIEKLQLDEIYDIFIIGGGATGCGIALDASIKGFNVALVERGDFSSGTSSKSTKLIHGGVRYLQNAIFNLDINEYYLVKEALHERKNFLNNASYLTNPLPIMIPIYNFWQVPYFWFGLKVYDLVAGFQFYRSSYFLSRDKSIDEFPLINSDNLWGSVIYYDGQMDDSRVNLMLAISSINANSTTVNYVEVIDLIQESEYTRVLCKDNVSGKEFECKTRIVINATGPFTDNIRKMHDKNAKNICRGASGTHIILPRYFCPKSMGILNAETSDGRVLFLLPWNEYTLAGTTDSPHKINETPKSTLKEIDFIIKELNEFLNKETQIKKNQILSAWCGIRPLVVDINKLKNKDDNTASISRNHVIENKGNFITIAGGKWTTYRSMAEDVIKQVIENFEKTEILKNIIKKNKETIKNSTKNYKLYGAENWSPYFYVNLIEKYKIDEEIAQYLSKKYGMASILLLEMSMKNGKIQLNRISNSFPYTVEEIRYCCLNEYVVSLTDVISRRMRLTFLNANESMLLLTKIADIVAEELKWDKNRKKKEIELAKLYIENEAGLKLLNQQLETNFND